MDVTFFHTGSAHPVVMALMAGKPFTLKDGEGATLEVRPQTEGKDLSVTVTGGDSAFRDIVTPVYLRGSFCGGAVMSIKVVVIDHQFCSPEGKDSPCSVRFS